MREYGLSRLATKKGRKRFRDSQLTIEEQAVWDSPERPDNIGRLLVETTKETVRQGKKIVKEKFR